MAHWNLRIGGMSCQHCVKTVRGLLEDVEGVEGVEVDVGSARLSASGPVDRRALAEALDEAGFDLESLEESPS